MGNLKFGTNSPLALYMGVSGSTKAYYGTTVVYEGGGKDYSKEYLTLEVLTGGTVQFTKTSGGPACTIYCSINNDPWVELSSTGSSFNVVANDIVRLKGTNSTYSTGNNNYCQLYGASATFNLSGNIMSLIYGDNFTGQTAFTTGFTFNNFFFNNTDAIRSAENLVLPATALQEKCYRYMFANCSKMTKAPKILPATAITGQYVYERMFSNCTSLTTAPELPATEIQNFCYDQMFYGCSSLTTAPELPALTLKSYCYRSMFNDCTSLTTAPELPATTLVSFCYQQMFEGCTSLNYVKCLATKISAVYCTNKWLAGVAASGTFEKAPNMTSWTTGVDGIPDGWTVVDAV